jgi:threonine dehydrogenase-like Zn-dependent dehydrogenase
MDTNESRFDRNIRLLGAAGQRRLETTTVAIAGVGGLGSHVVQQLAYLGVRNLILVDPDSVEPSNLNRLIGATPVDAAENRSKVSVARRLAQAVSPDIRVRDIRSRITADEASAIQGADVIFGCLDDDAPRLFLTELASKFAIPYIDLASDAGSSGGATWYGGRVLVSHDGRRCLSCAGLLDQKALAAASMTTEQRAAHDAIYGVDSELLDRAGPSVVSVNGVVASLGVTEFLALVTGLRDPIGQLNYYGHLGIVTTSEEPPSSDCYYCAKLFGTAVGSPVAIDGEEVTQK